jgi:hypothetical protein
LALGVSDFPALLEPGMHVLDVDRLYYIGVHCFPLSKRRPLILKGFVTIVCKLVEHAIRGDLIIDGSFLTQEIEPNDIDFALCVSDDFYLASSMKQRAYMDWIGEERGIKQTYLCDCYLCVECGVESPMYFDGIQTRQYWVNLYKYSRVVNRERGLAIIRLTGWLL